MAATVTLAFFGARSDRRGLAHLSALMWRCLQPAKTVVIDMGRHAVTTFDADRYGPDATTVTYDDAQTGRFDLDTWLEGVDVVLTFEIPYDPKLYDVCRRRGVKTVQLTMPELDGHQRDPSLPVPDVFALPTGWLADRYPESPVLPVPSDPWEHTPGGLVVHPGALAMKDRNGTRTVIQASRYTWQDVVVRQQRAPDLPYEMARVEVADLADSKDLYRDAGLVVIPRRYGGLSLSMQEAMSAGLPLLVPETDPYAEWLPDVGRLPCEHGRPIQCKGGTIWTVDVHPRVLAERVDEVAASPSELAVLAAAAERWATAHAWDTLEPAWLRVLAP